MGCFHECKILRDFAIICFCQNTQFKKYCIWFLRRKMLDPVLDPVPKSCLALRFFLQTAKYFAKFELNVNCLNNFLELFSKSSRIS